MFLKSKRNFIQHFVTNPRNFPFLIRQCSTGSFLQYDKDPAPMFIDPKIQKLLKSLTGMDFSKIFRKKAVSHNKVDFKFMTPEQFESQVKHSAYKAKRLLQMPPIVKILEDQTRILSKDTEMDGFSDSDYVITDISFDVKDTKRAIVVRHANGILETAPQSIRKRVNQIYFPKEERKITVPLMFTREEYLQRLLDNYEYQFILDRTCIQFEPYEREFHEITSKTYQHINKEKKFDMLRSTRHFGTMTFFLTWHKMIDDLLIDCIKRGYLRNGVELILLFHKIHGGSEEKTLEACLEKYPYQRDIVKEYYDSMISGVNEDLHKKIDYDPEKLKEEQARDENFLKEIENFTKTHGVKKIQLELAVQTFREEKEGKFDSMKRQKASS
uniref:CSON008091 protein n=2 Tax=Culicoides sonorensis TaxID=179676 RepID=A0A336MAH8_CULSO